MLFHCCVFVGGVLSHCCVCVGGIVLLSHCKLVVSAYFVGVMGTLFQESPLNDALDCNKLKYKNIRQYLCE